MSLRRVGRAAAAAAAVVVAGVLVLSLAALFGTPPNPGIPRPSPRNPVQNHTLTAGDCGPSRRCQAWHMGSIQCNLDGSGAIVALHRSGAPVSYSGTRVQCEIACVDANWFTQGQTNYSCIRNEDCTNFVSEALHARGWGVTSRWSPNTID